MECFISFEEKGTSKFNRRLNDYVADFIEEETINVNVGVLNDAIDVVFEMYSDVVSIQGKAEAFDKLVGLWDLKNSLLEMKEEMKNIKNFDAIDIIESNDDDDEQETEQETEQEDGEGTEQGAE